MKKALLIALGLCANSISAVHAAPLMKNFNHPHAMNQKDENATYTDFSGTWTSPNCQGTTVTLTIQNSDDVITINEEEMTIGNLKTTANSGNKSPFGDSLATETMVRAVEWNADKTQLIVRQLDVNKAFDIQDNAELVDTAMYLDIENITLALEKDSLLLKFNTASYKDLQRIDTAHPTCIFTKVTQ